VRPLGQERFQGCRDGLGECDRLRHRDLRQVAFGQRATEPADRSRIRPVLRHPARHFLGLVHLQSSRDGTVTSACFE
jgi:hypothetical protein